MCEKDKIIKIKDALRNSGFPLEIKVLDFFNKNNIKGSHSRYINNDMSRDIDFLGVLSKNNHTNDKYFSNIMQRVLVQVKSLKNYNIVFYPNNFDNSGNEPILYPNFLNNKSCCLRDFGGGVIYLQKLKEIIPNISFSKLISVQKPAFLDKKRNKKEKDHFIDNGNKPIFEESNDIIKAINYLYKKELNSYYPNLNGIKHFLMSTIYPIIVVDSKIYEVTDINSLNLKERKCFFYSISCSEIEKYDLATKNYYYLPILITTFDGLSEVLEILKKLSKLIDEDFKILSKDDRLLEKSIDSLHKYAVNKINNIDVI